MSTTRKRPINVFVPVILVIAGIAYAALMISKGHLWLGLGTLAVFVLLAAGAVFFGRRSEIVAMLVDDVHEERNVHLHARASLYTVNILAAVLVIGGIVDFLRGGDGWPWAPLAALMAVVYLASLFILNRRS
ncbi:hypothetical protein [Fodinicola acaciae]|uniref:hypothetical protein n=1 Tax=Fodinicola acaciae TaxID=2681555 RepID=UPI0013D14B42|nr:hypothetical protein [Fodinicola acaciae]